MGFEGGLRPLAAAVLLCEMILCLAFFVDAAAGNSPAKEPSQTLASNSLLRIESDGTIRIANLTLPPSEFWSPEFKISYLESSVNMMAMGRGERLKIPAATASKSEWDNFDAENDRYLYPDIDWAERHYPVDIVDTHIVGVHVGVITPRQGLPAENERRVLINLHGGGFIAGRGLSTGELESISLASIGGFRILTIDYRQAPNYKFPAATEDVVNVYRELLKQYRPGAIGIFGNSAGGVLAAQALVSIHRLGLPRPGAVGLFWAGPSPFWTPPRFSKQGDSLVWLRAFYPAHRSNGPKLADYMEGADPKDPAANPAGSDVALARFPPTLFVTGTRAFDMSSAVSAHARLLKLGVDSCLYVMEGGLHEVDLTLRGVPEKRDLDVYKAKWFNQHLER